MKIIEPLINELKDTLADSKRGWLETHDVPDWFKKAGPND